MTPIQLAFAVSALAEWGERWKPHVVLSWRKSDGSVNFTKPQHLEPVNLPQDILSFIRTAMQHVVNAPGGTAERFFPGVPYTLAGKTGTAQVYSLKNDERYDTKTVAAKLRDNSLFIAFAPVEKPSIALAIVIQNSVTPAPQIARKLLDYYLIPPSPIPTITSQHLPVIVPEKKPDNQLDESINLSNSSKSGDTSMSSKANKTEAADDEDDSNEIEDETPRTKPDKNQVLQADKSNKNPIAATPTSSNLKASKDQNGQDILEADDNDNSVEE